MGALWLKQRKVRRDLIFFPVKSIKGLVNDITVRDFDFFNIRLLYTIQSRGTKSHMLISEKKKKNWDYEAFLAWEKVKTVNCSFT